MRRSLLRGVLGITALAASPMVRAAAPAVVTDPAREAFIESMADHHGFEPAETRRILAAAEERPSILKVLNAPPTSRPWFEFRPRYVNSQRIAGGVRFWRQYGAVLERASAEFGLPVEMIVATIGIETLYGRQMGSFRVIDALVTIAFGYPRRAEYFRGELEQFLLAAREHDLNPLEPKGSYAGAMGYAQFMPSSLRLHAVDFNGDGRIDLWRHPGDSIGSVGNYYRKHGWMADAPVAVPAEVNPDAVQDLVNAGVEPQRSAGELRAAGVTPLAPVDDAVPAAVITLLEEAGPRYWLVFRNFYAITRYNRSLNYAMSVHDLAREIRRAYEAAG